MRTSENLIENLDGDGNEPPTSFTHRLVLATRSYRVICVYAAIDQSYTLA